MNNIFIYENRSEKPQGPIKELQEHNATINLRIHTNRLGRKFSFCLHHPTPLAGSTQCQEGTPWPKRIPFTGWLTSFPSLWGTALKNNFSFTPPRAQGRLAQLGSLEMITKKERDYQYQPCSRSNHGCPCLLCRGPQQPSPLRTSTALVHNAISPQMSKLRTPSQTPEHQ